MQQYNHLNECTEIYSKPNLSSASNSSRGMITFALSNKENLHLQISTDSAFVSILLPFVRLLCL